MSFRRQEGSFINGRGERLHTLSYVPEHTVKALLIFHHGYGEHSGRYEPILEMLSIADVAVHTYDAHGHGRSEPHEAWDRHLIWDFQHMVNDLTAYAAEVKKRYSAQLPCFVGGHSMGALTSTLVALQDQSAWAGLVCCSATVDVEWNWFLRLQASIGGLLAAVIPRARIVPAVRGEDMSNDPQALQEMEEDPLNGSGNVRARTANEFLKAFRWVFEHEHKLCLPIYAHHGTHDRLANMTAVKRMLRNAASCDVTLHEVVGGFHEVMMGSERADVTQRMIQWLKAHSRSKYLSTGTQLTAASQKDFLDPDNIQARMSTSSDESCASCMEVPL